MKKYSTELRRVNDNHSTPEDNEAISLDFEDNEIESFNSI